MTGKGDEHRRTSEIWGRRAWSTGKYVKSGTLWMIMLLDGGIVEDVVDLKVDNSTLSSPMDDNKGYHDVGDFGDATSTMHCPQVLQERQGRQPNDK